MKNDYSKIVPGYKQGALTVLGVEKIGQKIYFLRECDCGKRGKSARYYFIKGQQSCGCLHRKQVGFQKTHGLSKTPLWKKIFPIYNSIYARCNNPKQKPYKYYGGLGIKCRRESPKQFYDDMVQSYIEHVKIYGEKNTTIDRIDANGDYCKENCRWATLTEQARNKRHNVHVEIEGKIYYSRDIAEQCGISLNTAASRVVKYNQGKTDLETLFHKGLIDRQSRKFKRQIFLEINGEKYTSKKISEKTGLSISGAQRRMKKYLNGTITIDKLFTPVI